MKENTGILNAQCSSKILLVYNLYVLFSSSISYTMLNWAKSSSDFHLKSHILINWTYMSDEKKTALERSARIRMGTKPGILQGRRYKKTKPIPVSSTAFSSPIIERLRAVLFCFCVYPVCSENSTASLEDFNAENRGHVHSKFTQNITTTIEKNSVLNKRGLST